MDRPAAPARRRPQRRAADQAAAAVADEHAHLGQPLHPKAHGHAASAPAYVDLRRAHAPAGLLRAHALPRRAGARPGRGVTAPDRRRRRPAPGVGARGAGVVPPSRSTRQTPRPWVAAYSSRESGATVSPYTATIEHTVHRLMPALRTGRQPQHTEVGRGVQIAGLVVANDVGDRLVAEVERGAASPRRPRVGVDPHRKHVAPRRRRVGVVARVLTQAWLGSDGSEIDETNRPGSAGA